MNDNPPTAQYRFFPWARRGIATALTNADTGAPLPLRAPLALGVTLNVTNNGATSAVSPAPGTNAALYGPGDVIGIDPRHVIRTEPRPFTANFEPNYVCAIEFDQPDFPWLFTPAAPNVNRVRPWVALIALVTGVEFEEATTAPNPLPSITVKKPDPLQDLSDSWNWAHAQVTGTQDLASMLASNPGNVISRLVCPRRLDPETSYTVFLVPAFDAGRLAGLGQAPSGATTVDAAWIKSNAGAFPLALPYYYRFEFHTSDEGDFESLVRRLTPRNLPAEVGYRNMDVTQPAAGYPSAGGPLGLQGALKSIHTQDTDWQEPEKDTFQIKLQEEVNMTSPAVDDPLNPAPDDPKVVPPMYGRWHAAVTGVDRTSDDWISDLSLDPRNRSGAGMGTQVVVNGRSALMASAWKQYAGLDFANQILRQLQLARATMQQVYDQQLRPAVAGTLVALTASVHSRMLGSAQTVAAKISQSPVPTRMLSGSFRRITRARGPLRRRQGMTTATPALIDRVNAGSIEIAPIPPSPAGMVPLEALSLEQLPSWLQKLPRWALWALIAIVLLIALAIVIAVFVIAGPAAGIVVALVVIGILAWAYTQIKPLLAQEEEATILRFDGLSDAMASIAPRPSFAIVPVETSANAAGGASDSADAQAFRSATASLGAEYVEIPKDAPPAPALDLVQLRDTIMTRLTPATTFAARKDAVLTIDPNLVGWKPADPIDPIMAAPKFDDPMYVPLKGLSQEYVLPGAELIPPETVGVVVANHRFIEAYMVGLNHEMARQLLWNRFPTDQRGSYFRQFWDVSNYVPQKGDPSDPAALHELEYDIPPIHTWPHDVPLGDHPNRTDVALNNVVLLVKGELLKRYPNAIIYAGKAQIVDGRRTLDPSDERYPIFGGNLGTDITFFGFNLSVDDARGGTAASPQGFFFVFQEHFNEPRFGLEPGIKGAASASWADLAWTDFVSGSIGSIALPRLERSYTTYRLASQTFSAVLAGVASGGGSVPDFLSATRSPNVNPATFPAPDNTFAWGKDAAQTAYITLRLPFRILIHADLMLGAP